MQSGDYITMSSHHSYLYIQRGTWCTNVTVRQPNDTLSYRLTGIGVTPIAPPTLLFVLDLYIILHHLSVKKGGVFYSGIVAVGSSSGSYPEGRWFESTFRNKVYS